MCKKQTAVSHSSTESEIISLDTGLRLDGLLALELWDQLFLSLGTSLKFQIEQGYLLMMSRNINNLKGRSMWWRILIPFPQMSNPRVKKLYCMCLKTMKQWSRWSLKEGVLQCDMFPGPTELHLTGCLIELIWTPKSKSNTSTPKTNSLTFWPKEISRVMSGIICCACLILAISVLQFALLQWRSDLNKIQEKNESQQNQDLWWILLPGRHRSCRLQLQWARGRSITETKIHGNQLLEKIDQGDLVKKQIYSKPTIITTMSNSWRASLQQIIQNWIMTVLGLLNSGKLGLRRTIDQGDLMKLLWEWCEK